MKNIINKSTVIAFIFGGIIIGSISGVVAYTYSASQISYEPSDNTWEVNNVESAINDLKANSVLDFSNTNFSSSQGSRTANRSATLNFSKGKYLVFRIVATTVYEATNTTSTVSEYQVSNTIQNGSCEKLDSRYVASVASTKYSNVSNYEATKSFSGIYECDFNDNGSFTAADDKFATVNYLNNQVILYSVKIR